MDASQHMTKARALLKSIAGKSMNVEERREAAIELAAFLLNEARRIQTNTEMHEQEELAGMMNDPAGKAFTVAMTDQCFRTDNASRVADQMHYLLKKFGIPKFLSYDKRAQLLAFRSMGKAAARLIVPLAKKALRKKSAHLILPGEKKGLQKHIKKRFQEGVRVNLNYLGEAILGEEEAKRRLEIYLEALRDPNVEYVSVKISTICSQLNLLAWEDTVELLSERFRELLRVAKENEFVRPNGKVVKKFVNLDMEEYHDLHLTVELFRRVLDEPEFYQVSAGIVLQAYLPESYLILQELTVWAMSRVAGGGSPIKVRIVKGANLAMERVDASLHGWAQTPYASKPDVDSNYKRMIAYACDSDHAKASHVGIASHNLFDIAYAFLLRAENQVEEYVEFEMLEGMADPIQRVVQDLSGGMLLYCPVASYEDFQYAIAYLVRRLDENTAEENFLRHAFELIPETKEWYQQTSQFSFSCHHAKNLSFSPRRVQNRLLEPSKPELFSPFKNEADTDWTLSSNRKWVNLLLTEWKEKSIEQIPLVIAGEEVLTAEKKAGVDPSVPKKSLYHYSLASEAHVDQALSAAENGAISSEVLAEVAHCLRKKRGELIGVMVADAGKTVPEADVEVTEAIDFVEYYYRNFKEWTSFEDLQWQPKGCVLVAPPWNFSCSIPAGCIAAALTAGNSVIFKPAPETVWVGWCLARAFWEAGVSKTALQFVTGEDGVAGNALIKDPRVKTVVLTGATETALMMSSMRSDLQLIAETGGKNALIVTNLSDRDLAIKHLVESSFGHAGQKCSACSLAILESEVYDSKKFLDQLKDAAKSWRVGSSWDLATRVNPLIRPPDEKLMRGLTRLDEGEEWLLEPKQDPDNPNLWSPGIKIGVKPGSFTHQTELFGPVLAVMRADNLDHAIELANGTRYGLTSGIHSLDEREQKVWMEKIEAGNCYINRSITGAIVRRQPFGGCKESSFGMGLKPGGPNYLTEFMDASQVDMPKEETEIGKSVNLLTRLLEKRGLTPDQLMQWRKSVGNYAYYWKKEFSQDHDESHVLGQDNILRYVPRKGMVFRLSKDDELLDSARVIAAALTCGTPLEVSGDEETLNSLNHRDFEWESITWVSETEEELISRCAPQTRVRLISPPSERLKHSSCFLIAKPIFSSGRLELLNYLREVSFSIDYHRYGNLGTREV